MVLVELLAFPVTARSMLIPSSMITGRNSGYITVW